MDSNCAAMRRQTVMDVRCSFAKLHYQQTYVWATTWIRMADLRSLRSDSSRHNSHSHPLPLFPPFGVAYAKQRGRTDKKHFELNRCTWCWEDCTAPVGLYQRDSRLSDVDHPHAHNWFTKSAAPSTCRRSRKTFVWKLQLYLG